MVRELASTFRNENIRFLTIVSALTRGGTERAAVNYALGYHRAGMPSAVLAYSGAGPRKEVLDDAGIPVFVGGKSRGEQSAAIEQARAWTPDILHLNRPGLPDPISGSIVRSLLRSNMRSFETNVFSCVDETQDRLLFDLHFHLSHWCLWKWTQASRELEGRAPGVVVPYPVDTSSFSPATPEQRTVFRSALGIPADAVVFGRIGQPSPSKWSPILIESFRIAAEQFPHVWLVLVGCSKQLESSLLRLPSGVRARVKQLPLVDTDLELQSYYGSMDVFAHAAEKGESFGMVLCEAMLCGLPVITLNTPLRDNSQIEVVQNGKTGLVVSNRWEFTRAMLILAKDENLRRELGRNGPPRVRQNYAISAVIPFIFDLARIALASNSSQELASHLASHQRIAQAIRVDTQRDLLISAGIKPTFSNTFIASLVNQRSARQAISLVRSLQRLSRG
jgi:glycosyltransferase involved in cell wall biosynthesis